MHQYKYFFYQILFLSNFKLSKKDRKRNPKKPEKQLSSKQMSGMSISSVNKHLCIILERVLKASHRSLQAEGKILRRVSQFKQIYLGELKKTAK